MKGRGYGTVSCFECGSSFGRMQPGFKPSIASHRPAGQQYVFALSVGHVPNWFVRGR